MTFFFDRSVGTSVPLALRSLRIPVTVEYHDAHFPVDAPDDVWLPVVGDWEWFVIGHDSKFHLRPNELQAHRSYNIGCFYLWGGEASRWEKMRLFARAYDRILATTQQVSRPFVFRVLKDSRLVPVRL